MPHNEVVIVIILNDNRQTTLHQVVEFGVVFCRQVGERQLQNLREENRSVLNRCRNRLLERTAVLGEFELTEGNCRRSVGDFTARNGVPRNVSELCNPYLLNSPDLVLTRERASVNCDATSHIKKGVKGRDLKPLPDSISSYDEQQRKTLRQRFAFHRRTA